ncbi:tetratricopeptide repeat protein, partial [Campylobacter molothri]|uniref:tetratricopeptide repeat protein n=1 Tax=Campylobacter molothri TaxID=1032242 RepID=UPI001D918D33|nr:tetratricopeptide repeat protein [Campylobacter sp. RM9759]
NYFDYCIEKQHYKNNLVINKSFIEIYDFLQSCKIKSKDWLEIQKIHPDITFAFVCVGLIDFSFLKKIKLKFLDYIIHEDHHFGILLFLQSSYILVLTEKLYHYRIATNTTCTYDKKITKANLPNYIKNLYDEFQDVKLTKEYFMLSSILLNALSIIDYIKQQEESYKTDLEDTFFNFLYLYHFGLYEFKKDPLGVIQKLKNIDILSLENKKKYQEFYFFQKYGTATQKIKSDLSYKIGFEIMSSFKNKIQLIKLPYNLYKILSNHTYNINSTKLPLEAYPDYEQAKKIQSFLFYQIGQLFTQSLKNKFNFFKLPYKIVLTIKKFKRNQKIKKRSFNKKEILDYKKTNKQTIFTRYDLIDIFYGKKIKKSYFLKDYNNYISWICDLNREFSIENIIIDFNTFVKKKDFAIYFTNDNYNFKLIPKEWYFAENEKKYFINIEQKLKISCLKIVTFNPNIDVQNISIFIRKTPGYIISAKPDAFGMRLAGILIGIYLSKQINFKFAFTWKKNIDVDFLDVQKSIKKEDIYYLGNAIDDANIIFDKKFLDEFLIESKLVSESWGHNLGFNKRSLQDLKNGIDADESWGWYSTDILPSKWIKNCNEEECLNVISQIYRTINFSEKFKEIIDNVDLIYKNLGSFIALHIRGGEMIFSNSRKLPNWSVFQERYFPYEIALEIIQRELRYEIPIVIFGQDLKSNAILKKYICERNNNSNIIKCADDFIETNYSDLERSFFDMNLMSKANKIYSARESAFSKVAMMISGRNNLISYHDIFNLHEQYEIIKNNLFVLKLHDLHIAMSYFRLYLLSKQLNKNSLEFLKKALEYDNDNDAYRIYIIDYYLQQKQYDKAERILKYVYENRKDMFLKNFFDNSCRSFENEYKTYLSCKENSSFYYINDMTIRIKKWIEK